VRFLADADGKMKQLARLRDVIRVGRAAGNMQATAVVRYWLADRAGYFAVGTRPD
jgi:hypothetical protein